MSVSRYETSLAVVQQAAIECGLSLPSAVFASTDANVILLRNLLNSCGRELGMMRPWRHLIKSGSFTAAAVVAPAIHGVNALATDFDYAIDGTFWNATDSERPVEVDPVRWEYHLANVTTPSPSVYRLEGNAVWLYGPSAGDSFTYKYVSRYWVKPSGQTAPTAAASTADTDALYHHPLLLVRLLKVRFMQARGMDTAAALVDFETTYANVAGREQVAPVLTLGGGRTFKFLDVSNVPDSGFGS